jgi:hypothetical protein
MVPDPPQPYTFIGTAGKAELYSPNGEPYAVTVFRVETIETTRRTNGNQKIPWLFGGETAILADPTGIVFAPDSYAGKRLEVTAIMGDLRILRASSRGPSLKLPPPELGMKLQDAGVLHVKGIKVLD